MSVLVIQAGKVLLLLAVQELLLWKLFCKLSWLEVIMFGNWRQRADERFSNPPPG